jgi:hypothetical protein
VPPLFITPRGFPLNKWLTPTLPYALRIVYTLLFITVFCLGALPLLLSPSPSTLWGVHSLTEATLHRIAAVVASHILLHNDTNIQINNILSYYYPYCWPLMRRWLTHLTPVVQNTIKTQLKHLLCCVTSPRLLYCTVLFTLLHHTEAAPSTKRNFTHNEVPLFLPTVVALSSMVIATLNIRSSFMARNMETIHNAINQMATTKTKILVLTETGYILPSRVNALHQEYPAYHIFYTATPNTDTCHPRNQGVAIIVHKSMKATVPNAQESVRVLTPYRTLALTLAPAPNTLFHIVGYICGSQTPPRGIHQPPLAAHCLTYSTTHPCVTVSPTTGGYK